MGHTGTHRPRTRRLPVVAAVLLASLTLALGAPAAVGPPPRRASAPKPIRLDDATIIVEVNATDGDAGLQVFLDGEPWRVMRVYGPDGRRILAVKARGRLKGHGLTELFSESSEPPFDELPLREFKRRFPEGTYRFVGRTVEGGRLVGRATLTHDIPRSPRILTPEEEGAVPRDAAVVSWEPVTRPGGIDIVGYRAIVTREQPLRVLSVDLPAWRHQVTIPPEFLKPGVEYKVEVQAIEASGNQTITEVGFSVA